MPPRASAQQQQPSPPDSEDELEQNTLAQELTSRLRHMDDIPGKQGFGKDKEKPPPIPAITIAPVVAPAPIRKKKERTQAPSASTSTRSQMEVAFEHMVQRVDLMWMELKMDKREREFYTRALMRGPCEHLSQCHALAKYLVVLQDYRLATIDVLRDRILHHEPCRNGL